MVIWVTWPEHLFAYLQHLLMISDWLCTMLRNINTVGVDFGAPMNFLMQFMVLLWRQLLISCASSSHHHHHHQWCRCTTFLVVAHARQDFVCILAMRNIQIPKCWCSPPLMASMTWNPSMMRPLPHILMRILMRMSILMRMWGSGEDEEGVRINPSSSWGILILSPLPYLVCSAQSD